MASTSEIPSVLLVGAGGLSHSALWGLASALTSTDSPGLRVLILDDDKVELSNLNRQIFFSPQHVGRFKAEALVESFKDLFPASRLQLGSRVLRVSEENIGELISWDSFDYVLDCSDSVPTKFLLSDFCRRLNTAYCYAGAVSYEGQLLAVDPRAKDAACLRCLFGDFSQEDYCRQNTSCSQAGILGPVVSLIGLLQAEVCSRFLSAREEATSNSLMYRYDFFKARLSKSFIQKDSGCEICRSALKLLDLRAVKCPQTFLYAKLALEASPSGEQLEICFATEESLTNVRQSLIEQGYEFLSEVRRGRNFKLLMRSMPNSA